MTPRPYKTDSGTRYRVAYRTPDGKQHTKRGFSTKTAARAWYRRQMVKIENHGFNDSDHVTFGEVTKRWLDNKLHLVEASTYRKYLDDCNCHLIPDLGDRLIKDIDIPTAQHFVYLWAGQLKKFNKLVDDAAGIFDLAIKYQLAYTNPFRLVDKPRRKDKRQIRSFTREEFDRFNQALEEYYKPKNYKAYAFLYTLAHTGLRKAELLALTWNNVDYEEGMLHIKKAATRDINRRLIVGKTKNAYSVRDVPMGNRLSSVLKTWRVKQREELKLNNVNSLQPHQLVFTSQNGGLLSPSKPNIWMNMIEKKYGLPEYVSPHGLRHTYATLLIEDGVSVNEVAACLGHGSTATTLRVYNDLHGLQNNKLGNTIEKL